MAKFLFHKVSIIGMGLMGSSLGRAIIAKKICQEVIGYDLKLKNCKIALKYNAITQIANNLASAVKDANLVILAIPMGEYEKTLKIILSYCTDNLILSDLGSVKSSALAMMTAGVKINDQINGTTKNIHIIPAHPIAGTEQSGPEHGMAYLFQDMYCLLTPPEKVNKSMLRKYCQFWQKLGAKVEIINAQHHDEVLALTSHLPHLIAYTIVGTAQDFEHVRATDTIARREVLKYAAGGWRDFTRIASSSPVMWRDIFLQNKSAVLNQLTRFQDDLDQLTKAIKNNDGDFLLRWFEKTRTARRALLHILPTELEQQKNFYKKSKK